jgi:hypothetical protein
LFYFQVHFLLTILTYLVYIGGVTKATLLVILV